MLGAKKKKRQAALSIRLVRISLAEKGSVVGGGEGVGQEGKEGREHYSHRKDAKVGACLIMSREPESHG